MQTPPIGQFKFNALWIELMNMKNITRQILPSVINRNEFRTWRNNLGIFLVMLGDKTCFVFNDAIKNIVFNNPRVA